MNTSSQKCSIGLIGLGIMGRNLAFSLKDKGHRPVVFDPMADVLRQFPARDMVRPTLSSLCADAGSPKRILLMVKAGLPVDHVIDALIPFLDLGDIVMDGGNSHFVETMERAEKLREKGVHFFGIGISGGEQGARTGASLMVGGDPAVWRSVRPLLEDIAARVDGSPCLALLGPDGAGHFVKMVHNAVEYALMQAISESCLMLTHIGGFDYTEMAEIFAVWNRGRLASYLIEITAHILNAEDDDTGLHMLDVICGAAGQKGTGRWAVSAAMELGVPVPTIYEAVAARNLSTLKGTGLGSVDSATPGISDRKALVDDIEAALLGSYIVAFAQGFALIAGGAGHYDWPLDMAEICRIWRGGCIIRADILGPIEIACSRQPGFDSLLSAPDISDTLAGIDKGWRRCVALGLKKRLPIPLLSSSLCYLDGCISGIGGGAVIQAQRDFFGGHGFGRTDKPGRFHKQWGLK